jgi:hypothetical protein
MQYQENSQTRVLYVLAAMVAAVYLAAPTASARAEFCVLQPDEGGTDCGYPTLQSCLDARAGVGGRCHENAMASPATAEPSKKAKKRVR